ncbi:MAG: PQQ-binding-like beta-propeller repeat protein, partial [Armatimonadota bacterium]
MHRSSRSWLAYITLGLAHLLLAGAAGAQSPRAILEATGVKGGLIVHVPCGDGTLTTALRVNDRFLVHGLDTDAANVAQARARAQSLGLHGEATFSVLKGRRLPFIDNTVNLLVSEGLGGISTREVMRILAPDGVAYVKRNGQWTSTPKPRPREIDDWTHFLHGPDGNPVARDSVVGPPFHMQWVGAPSHSKSHSHLASINVIVSAGGRIFYFVDEGPTALPHSLASQWNLVARDAFNGVTLWRRPLSSWQPADLSGRNFFPVDLFRRLVTDGQRVYATLSIFGPVVALDPATGETIRTYEGTENTEEIICHEGTLFLVVGTTSPDDIDRRALAQRRGEPAEQRIMAISAETGSVLWEKRGRDTNGVMPMTLAARGRRALFQNTENVICLEARTGDELWRSPRPASYARPSWSAPTLVVHDDVVLCADRGAATAASARTQNRAGQTRSGDLVVLSAKTGERLWSSPCAEGCRSPIDVFVANGRVWLGEEMARKP